ncbi:Ligand-binding SRPBCC domain-containing protein [Chitinophaga costaii]|uniref:Ligand-binding SRPBCC domain-containing protein n=1 Tax=Chitinophaga costaii TaxID=1335309 RepID=A0A1C4A7L6_9BACT|nr:SRPBCC family protein [Chitinophaga costaii]PUZ26495.1 hypothetical protein DCM91_08735 [Chitinophaga costaii]SCB90648.1 Ligand-binding SRPBCC domain-containing protein [Chitinophaga costaii]
MAAIHRLERTQNIPIDLEQAWNFFSRPGNLEKITPAYMRFRITSPPVARMYAGEVITYFIRPLLGIPLAWMTEITHVQEGRYFVDEQKKGPYALWHHQHHFEAVPGGIKMTDIVHYQLPLGFLGTLAGKLFVNRQLEDIFAYRREAIEQLFGSMN